MIEKKMNWASIELVWAVIAGIVSALFALIVTVAKIAIRYGSLSLQVQTMWDYQMRRAMSEVVYTGIGQVNSPLRFTPDAIASLDPIKTQLMEFWKTLPDDVSDAEALLLIESQFGNELLKLVCIPCKLSHGACLLLALGISKGNYEVSFPPTRSVIVPPRHWWPFHAFTTT